MLLLETLLLWINEGRVRFVAHTSSCLSPWPGGIQATCIWYPARHRQTVHFAEQQEEYDRGC